MIVNRLLEHIIDNRKSINSVAQVSLGYLGLVKVFVGFGQILVKG
jgi:hypothetical protein